MRKKLTRTHLLIDHGTKKQVSGMILLIKSLRSQSFQTGSVLDLKLQKSIEAFANRRPLLNRREFWQHHEIWHEKKMTGWLKFLHWFVSHQINWNLVKCRQYLAIGCRNFQHSRLGITLEDVKVDVTRVIALRVRLFGGPAGQTAKVEVLKVDGRGEVWANNYLFMSTIKSTCLFNERHRSWISELTCLACKHLASSLLGQVLQHGLAQWFGHDEFLANSNELCSGGLFARIQTCKE